MINLPRHDDGTSRGVDPTVRAVRPAPSDTRPELRQALAVVWGRKWSILAITLLVVAVALFVSSRQTPIYESRARVLVNVLTRVGSDSLPLPQTNLATEAEVVDSVAVAEIVAANLGIAGPPRTLLGDLSVDQPPDTEILDIGYRHENPLQAQRRASAFANGYLEFRENAVDAAISSAALDIEDQISQSADELGELERELQTTSEDDPDRITLQARAVVLSTRITTLQGDLAGLPNEVPVGEIIQPAPLPSSPVSPNHVVNGAFGLVAGLGLGIVLAFLRDRLSERLRSTEEAEAYMEAPVLATIPRIPSWRRRREAFLVTAVQWRSPAAEGYRVLRTNLLSAASAAGVKSIAVTSAYPAEGKSATAANLAVVLARAGKHVTLMSADLRRPRVHEFFKRAGSPGLIEVLGGGVTVHEAVQTVVLPTHGFDTGPVKLRLLPSGHVPDDPTELITSERLSRVIRDLEDISDIVLIDVPPVLPVTDALVVAAVTKYVLLVIGPKADTRPAVTSARQQLDRVGARILGGVLNGADPSISQTYYSY